MQIKINFRGAKVGFIGLCVCEVMGLWDYGIMGC